MNNKQVVIEKITDVEKHLDNIDAVIFDLDDTLYSEKEYVRSGYHKIAVYFEIPELEKELWVAFEHKENAIDKVFEDRNMFDQKQKALEIYRFQRPDIHLYDGVEDMIERIKRTCKIGIITDGRPEGQYAKMKALNLDIDEVIVTDELGGIIYRKPNETAFRLMQERLNAPFQRMVYVGDNLRKDFIAPAKLGMQSIWFENREGLYYLN